MVTPMITGSPPDRSTGVVRPTPACLVALLAATACAPPPLSASDTAGADAPAIEILFPTSDESVRYCSSLIVVVGVHGIELAPESLGGDPLAGQGHWHRLDGGTYVVSTGDPGAAVEGDLALADSRHFFSAELVGNDHQSFVPPVTSPLVEFEVQDGPGCVGGATADEDTGIASTLMDW